MPDDDHEKRVRRLQALADAEWKTPRAIALDGPGPFELPLCGHASTLGRGSDPQFVLELETVGPSQRVRIPIRSNELPALRDLMGVLCNQYLASANHSH